MTDEVTTVEVEETEEVVIPEDESGPKQLRNALKREQEKSAGFRSKLMVTAYREAGLDPETLLGKAIAKEYDGEPTTEALLEYAKEEYGYTVAATPENEKQPLIQQGQQQVDALNSSSIPVESPTQNETLKEAEAEKDYVTAGNVKAAQLEKLMKP